MKNFNITECERLINESLFSKDFFKEEIRDGFLVSVERKKLWAIQIDLMNKLFDVCKRHNLRVYVFSGTLLGAARHKGFIPWDDDIDVAMPREDYEKLWDYRDQFLYPYVLQYPCHDNEYFYSFAKLRNSNTTQASKSFLHRNFNMGVMVDIFPLDFWDSKSKEGFDCYRRINDLNIDNSNYMRIGYPNPSVEMQARIAQWSGRLPEENIKEIDEIAKRFANSNIADSYATITTTIYSYEKVCFEREWFSSVVELPFEGWMVPAPIGYKNILERAYGDWKSFPPMEQRGVWHMGLICDTDKPYSFYKVTK